MNNDGTAAQPPLITVTKLEDGDEDSFQPPTEVLLVGGGASENNANQKQQQQKQQCTNPNCISKDKQLAAAFTREKELTEEVERLRTKIKAKNKRHKSRLEQLETQHKDELTAKDEEIRKLKMELEQAKKNSNTKKEDSKPKDEKTAASKPTRPSRRKSWSDLRKRSWSEKGRRRSSSNNNDKSNNSSRSNSRSNSRSRREMPRSFVIGGIAGITGTKMITASRKSHA